MTTSQFRRAKLVPFDAGGRDPQESRAIPLDFNPETLTLKVSGGEQRDRSRRGEPAAQGDPLSHLFSHRGATASCRRDGVTLAG